MSWWRARTSCTTLRPFATSLATLLINTCGGITAIDDIAALRNLSTLSVANCGNIDSLHPIAGLTELTGLYLYESTRIVDGDLEPLLGLRNLRDLRMKSRKHRVARQGRPSRQCRRGLAAARARAVAARRRALCGPSVPAPAEPIARKSPRRADVLCVPARQ
jgi:hypothetical protein